MSDSFTRTASIKLRSGGYYSADVKASIVHGGIRFLTQSEHEH